MTYDGDLWDPRTSAKAHPTRRTTSRALAAAAT